MKIYNPRSNVLERRSFEVATVGGIQMGTAVKLDSSSKIVVASDSAATIGIVDNDEAYRTTEATGTVAAGDRATVMLFGQTFKGVSAGTFPAGGFVTYSSGLLVSSGTAGATASRFVALNESTASDQEIEYLRLG